MNTGTAVFFTILFLVACFIGLGFVFNDNRNLRNQVAELERINAALTKDNKACTDGQAAIKQALNACTQERDTALQGYNDLTRSCQLPGSTPTSDPLNGLKTLSWVLVSAGGATGITTALTIRWKGGKRSRKPGSIQIDLSPSQMKEFIRWQRNHPAQEIK